MTKREFVVAVSRWIAAQYKTNGGRVPTMEEVGKQFADNPHMALERDGKPIFAGNKPITHKQAFARVLTQIDNATAPEAPKPDAKWQKSITDLRSLLGFGGRGRQADTTPAPDVDLEALLG